MAKANTGTNDIGSAQPSAQAKEEAADGDEIDIDEDEADLNEQQKASPDFDETEETTEDNDQQPKNKGQALRERLRKLKMKMNQAIKINRQEVLREGERLGSEDGKANERKRQALHDSKLRKAEWEAQHGKALDVAAEIGVDGKCLVEQAGVSMKNARKKSEKEESARFGINDYYNPEGQHRNYQRNLKSMPTTGAGGQADDNTFNPMAIASGEKEDAAEQEGARRLANEMKRRIEKQAKNKRNRLDFEGTDVSYINERNKRFNQKISRNFDEHTAEIRQNLERGTAL